MTYRLNPEVEKIISPIVLIMPDGEKRVFENGEAVAGATFEKRYIISSLQVVKDSVEIKLSVPEMGGSSWIGEEQISFF